MGEARYREILDMVPANLRATPEALRVLEALLRPAAAVDDYLTARRLDVPRQRVAALVDDALVPQLSALLGLGPDLPVRALATTDELRALCSVAAEVWRKKGREAAFRLLISAMTGSRSVILTWHELKTIEGAWGELVSLPVPSTAVGSPYDYPEHVIDAWYMPNFGSLNVELLTAMLDLVRPTGDRINLLEGLFLDDMQAGAVLWSQNEDGTGTWDPDAHSLTATDGHTYAVDLGGEEADWINFDGILQLNTTGQAEVIVLRDNADDGYAVLLDGPAQHVTVYRRVSGADTLLVDVAVSWAEGVPLRWRFGAWHNGIETTIRVRLEGAIVATAVDSDPARFEVGGLSWGAVAGGDNATTLTACLFSRDNATRTRIGPNP